MMKTVCDSETRLSIAERENIDYLEITFFTIDETTLSVRCWVVV